MEKQARKVLLHIQDLKQYFPVKKQHFKEEQKYVRANDGISLDIYEGETLGLVGESGCGKSTFGRTLLQLYKQTAGKTIYFGTSRDSLAPKYVEDSLKNLVNLRSQLKKEEGEKKSSLYLDLSQLIGGFLAVPDLRPVSEILLKEYGIRKTLRLLKEEENNLRITSQKIKKGENSPFTSQSVLHKINAKEREGEKQKEALKACLSSIQAMRNSYEKEEAFQEYEQYRNDGIDLAKLTYDEIRRLRKELQLIFQDPYSSLNPKMTVGQIISEGLTTHHIFKKGDSRIQDYVMETMEKCGLSSYMIHRYPHQFSGGQRQRIGIARSLALKPKFVVCDEAVSALDVSIQSQIINLLLDLKGEEHLTYLFISHDLSVVKYISDRVGVMYLGNLVELSETGALFSSPLHPYTEALLSAIPTTEVKKTKQPIFLEGDIPSPVSPPSGCKFHTRCPYCTQVCKEETPAFKEHTPGHFAACHHPVHKGRS